MHVSWMNVKQSNMFAVTSFENQHHSASPQPSDITASGNIQHTRADLATLSASKHRTVLTSSLQGIHRDQYPSLPTKGRIHQTLILSVHYMPSVLCWSQSSAIETWSLVMQPDSPMIHRPMWWRINLSRSSNSSKLEMSSRLSLKQVTQPTSQRKHWSLLTGLCW